MQQPSRAPDRPDDDTDPPDDRDQRAVARLRAVASEHGGTAGDAIGVDDAVGVDEAVASDEPAVGHEAVVVDETAIEPPPAAGLGSLPDPSALIFDLDGTLVDTVPTRIAAWLETFERVGIPADRKHVAGLIGADGRRLAHEVAGVAGRTLSHDKAEAIDRHAGERYGVLNTDPRPLPGASALLAALGGTDLPWAIATSSRAEQVAASVDALRLPLAPPIVDGSHVAHAKPAPDLLLLAAERLSVTARGCWYVGDATWDMRAARAATMIGIGVPSGAVSAEALQTAGATVTITSLEELAEELARRGLLAG